MSDVKIKILYLSMILTGIVLGLSFFNIPTASAHIVSEFSIQPDQNYTDSVTHHLNTKEGHPHIVITRGSEFVLPMTLKSEYSLMTSYSFLVTNDTIFTSEVILPGISIRVVPDHFIVHNGTDQKFNIVIKVDKNAPSGIYEPNLAITWKNNVRQSTEIHSISFQVGKWNWNSLERQVESGISPQHVICKSSSQVVIIKTENHSPACVEPDTVQKLIERGWTKKVSQTLLHTTPIVSSAPCDVPYPPSNTGVAVLYMPTNSTGKICATYHNPDSPTQSSVQVFTAKDMQQMASEITISVHPDIVPTGNSTIVYDVKTGSQAGFYGMSFFCNSIPFAVGYDNQSGIILDDFPWLYKNDMCLSQTNVFQITGLSGIHVKYVTVAHRG